MLDKEHHETKPERAITPTGTKEPLLSALALLDCKYLVNWGLKSLSAEQLEIPFLLPHIAQSLGQRNGIGFASWVIHSNQHITTVSRLQPIKARKRWVMIIMVSSFSSTGHALLEHKVLWSPGPATRCSLSPVTCWSVEMQMLFNRTHVFPHDPSDPHLGWGSLPF